VLLDIIIDSGAALFVSAVGVPPKQAVEKLHAAGIPVMKYVYASYLEVAIDEIFLSMIGHPKVIHFLTRYSLRVSKLMLLAC
jgi:hypothetical protein